jgi:hypothetical protein
MNRKLLWLAVLSLAATTAAADEPAAERQAAHEEPGVHAWLELQRSGNAASSQPQPLSGPAMDRAYIRYLKGFEHPQPMYFKHDESISNSK